jgi:hypothetical protein
MTTVDRTAKAQKSIDRDIDNIISRYTESALKLKRVTKNDVEEVLMTYKRIEYPWPKREKKKTGRSSPKLRAVFPVSPVKASSELQNIQPLESSDKLNILDEMERKKKEKRLLEKSQEPRMRFVDTMVLKRKSKSPSPVRDRKLQTSQSVEDFNRNQLAWKEKLKATALERLHIEQKTIHDLRRVKTVKEDELDDIVKRLCRKPIKPIEIPLVRASGEYIKKRPSSAPVPNSQRIIRMTEKQLKKKNEEAEMVK